MFILQEFELFEDEGLTLALPFGIEGGTQGTTFEEAAMMAADWLRGTAERWLMTGQEAPKPTIGNAPRHGGRVLLIGVTAELSSIPSMSAAEAAETLGVTRPRVSQMLATGRLMGWRDGRNTRITVDSVNARLAERPHAGRPRKTAVA